MEEFVGMAPELLVPSGNFSASEFCSKCFYLQLLTDAFMSEHVSYFLGSKSGAYIIFEITSVILSDLGSTSCHSEVPSPLFLTCNSEVVLFPFFFFLHEIRIFTETRFSISPCR